MDAEEIALDAMRALVAAEPADPFALTKACMEVLRSKGLTKSRQDEVRDLLVSRGWVTEKTDGSQFRQIQTITEAGRSAGADCTPDRGDTS